MLDYLPVIMPATSFYTRYSYRNYGGAFNAITRPVTESE